MDTKIVKALEKAKIELMMMPNTIFYTTILFSLKQSWTNRISTAAVNGTDLFINGIWFYSLTCKERVGLLAHELLHVALNHITRKGDRDSTIWNMACDYVINAILVAAGYVLPSGGLYDNKYSRYNVEQLYEHLLKQSKQNPSIPLVIPGTGADMEYPDTKQEHHDIEQQVADIVLKATIQSEAAGEAPGSIPGEIRLQLERILNPKLPWTTILANYMTDFNKDDYSMKKPNRRFLPDYYLPTAYSEAICNLTIAVDASGSVSPQEFSYFIAEIANIQLHFKPEKITLIDFDTQIKNITEITHDTDILRDVKFIGGGGTNITDLFSWINKNKPELTLIFTDGEFRMINVKPNSEIIWLIHDNPHWKCNFGKVIHYDI